MGESGLVSGFERYGVWWDEFGILLDFIGDFEYWRRVRFLSWYVE